MSEHCWHSRSFKTLPKKGHSLIGDRCCLCGRTRDRTVKSEKDADHGPYVDARKQVDVDVEEVPACGVGS